MKVLKIAVAIVVFALLTIITQVGGLVFLISLLTFGFIEKKINGRFLRLGAKLFSFFALYLLFTLAIVPLVAKPFGRVPLPIVEKNHVQPANLLTCLLNRNYVRPPLRDIACSVAISMNQKYPGAKVNYLDANFPFLNKFPLAPHLSHSDGKKLDLSFQYNNSETGELTNDVPSFIGYGVCEVPRAGEENMPAYCDRMGAWQYSLLQDIVPQDNKSMFTFDNNRNRAMVNFFAAHDRISRMYIEPHLKARLGLASTKIRFHGCKAVRHDDHLHVQIN
jgi:energy-coupling factor transporter transmembrane protein EcfT